MRAVAGVLSLTLSLDAPTAQDGWNYPVVAASVHPDHPAAQKLRQQNEATISLMTTALHPKDTSSCPPTYQSAPATRRRTRIR
jgi:hypothetical protein